MDESQRGPVHVEFRGVSKRYGQTVQAVRH